jgi:hypothetical protein
MKFFLAILLIFLPLSCAAETIEITCPARIETTQTIQSIPPHYSAFLRNMSLPFDRIAFYEGKPKRYASMAPDQEGSDKMPRATWIFNPASAYSISCGYNFTTIELFKKLPSGITSCEVDYDLNLRGSAGPIVTKVICKRGG